MGPFVAESNHKKKSPEKKFSDKFLAKKKYLLHLSHQNRNKKLKLLFLTHIGGAAYNFKSRERTACYA